MNAIKRCLKQVSSRKPISTLFKFLYKLLNTDSSYVVLFLFYVFFITCILIPFFKSDIQIWDSIGHLNLANSINLKDGFYTWDNMYWGGWVKGLYYPLLFHILVKLFSYIVSIELSYKIIVSIIGLLIPLVLFYLINLKIKERGFRFVIFLFSLLTYYFIPGQYLGSILGTFHAGGAPAILGTLLLLLIIIYFIKLTQRSNKFITKYVVILGMLGGLLILTHLFTTTVFGIYFLFFALIAVFRKDIRILRSVVFISCIITALVLFWIIPFFTLKEYLVTFGIPGEKQFLFILTIGLLLLLVSYYLSRKGVKNFLTNYDHALVLTTIILGFLTIFTSQNPRLLSSGVHFYRYSFFYSLFFPVSVYFLIRDLKINININIKSVFFVNLLIGLYFFCVIFPFVNLTHDYDLEVRLTNMPKIKGRVLDMAQDDLFTVDLPRTIGEEIVRKYHVPVFIGTYVESSENNYYISPLLKTLSPNSTVWTLPQPMVPVSDKEGLLRQYGINYIVSLRKDTYGVIKDEDLHPIEIGEVYDKNTHSKIWPIYLIQISDNDLAETLDYLPQYSPSMSQSKDWPKDYKFSDLRIVTGDCYTSDLSDINLTKPAVAVEEISNTELDLNIESETKAPILLKYSEFPFWHAYDINNTEIPICRIFPSSMFLVGNGRIQLKFEVPKYFYMLQVLSITVFGLGGLMLLIQVVIDKRQSFNRFKIFRRISAK